MSQERIVTVCLTCDQVHYDMLLAEFLEKRQVAKLGDCLIKECMKEKHDVRVYEARACESVQNAKQVN